MLSKILLFFGFVNGVLAILILCEVIGMVSCEEPCTGEAGGIFGIFLYGFASLLNALISGVVLSLNERSFKKLSPNMNDSANQKIALRYKLTNYLLISPIASATLWMFLFVFRNI